MNGVIINNAGIKSNSAFKKTTHLKFIEVVHLIFWALVLYISYTKIIASYLESNSNNLAMKHMDQIDQENPINKFMGCVSILMIFLSFFGVFIYFYYVLCTGIKQKHYHKLIWWIIFHILVVAGLTAIYFFSILNYGIVSLLNLVFIGIIAIRHYVIITVLELAEEISGRKKEIDTENV